WSPSGGSGARSRTSGGPCPLKLAAPVEIRRPAAPSFIRRRMTSAASGVIDSIAPGLPGRRRIQTVWHGRGHAQGPRARRLAARPAGADAAPPCREGARRSALGGGRERARLRCLDAGQGGALADPRDAARPALPRALPAL